MENNVAHEEVVVDMMEQKEFKEMTYKLTKELMSIIMKHARVEDNGSCSYIIYDSILASISSTIVTFLCAVDTEYKQKWADFKNIIIAVENSLSEQQKIKKQH